MSVSLPYIYYPVTRLPALFCLQKRGEAVYTSVMTNTGERQPALPIITHEIQRVKHKIEMKSRSALWWLISLFQVFALILIMPELSTLPLEERFPCQGFCHSCQAVMKERPGPILLSARDKPHTHLGSIYQAALHLAGEGTHGLRHAQTSVHECLLWTHNDAWSSSGMGEHCQAIKRQLLKPDQYRRLLLDASSLGCSPLSPCWARQRWPLVWPADWFLGQTSCLLCWHRSITGIDYWWP